MVAECPVLILNPANGLPVADAIRQRNMIRQEIIAATVETVSMECLKKSTLNHDSAFQSEENLHIKTVTTNPDYARANSMETLSLELRDRLSSMTHHDFDCAPSAPPYLLQNAQIDEWPFMNIYQDHDALFNEELLPREGEHESLRTESEKMSIGDTGCHPATLKTGIDCAVKDTDLHTGSFIDIECELSLDRGQENPSTRANAMFGLS